MGILTGYGKDKLIRNLIYSALLGGGVSGLYSLYRAMQTDKNEGGILEYKPIVKENPSILKTSAFSPEGEWYKPLAALTTVLGFMGGGYGMTKLIKYLLNQKLNKEIDKTEGNVYKDIKFKPEKVAMCNMILHDYNPVVDEASNMLAEAYAKHKENIKMDKTAAITDPLLNFINDYTGVPLNNLFGNAANKAAMSWIDALKRLGKYSITVMAPASALALLAGMHYADKNMTDADTEAAKSKKVKDLYDEMRGTKAVRV